MINKVKKLLNKDRVEICKKCITKEEKMDFRESLIGNYEDKTLEFCGKNVYVAKQFDYKGITYLYVVDVNTVNTDNVEFAFLYRTEKGLFKDVTDQELFEELIMKATGLMTADAIKDICKNENNQEN